MCPNGLEEEGGRESSLPWETCLKTEGCCQVISPVLGACTKKNSRDRRFVGTMLFALSASVGLLVQPHALKLGATSARSLGVVMQGPP